MSRETEGQRGLMGNQQTSRRSYDRLERALCGILGTGEITKKLSQVLTYAAVEGRTSYQKIKELAVRTTKSSAWEDRLLLLKDGEIYEIPNLIRYLVKHALDTGRWDPKNTIIELFNEFGDPDWEQIPGFVGSIVEKATDYKINSNQIKKICLQFGLNNRVDALIAELKAAGIISPKLVSIPDVLGATSPIYELNPSVII